MPVVAAADGTVTFSGGVPNVGYGYYVMIDDGNGYTTLYAHLLAPSFLKAGDHVVQGQMIGLSGSTGHSTGPHLHFEIRLDGVPIDPLPVLAGLLPRPLQP
jgi:murein DD-endopeptidase MepM/ murein hydrolase activator NlpD